jgi:ferredoxin
MLKSIFSTSEKRKKARALAKLMDSKNTRMVMTGSYLDFFEALLDEEEMDFLLAFGNRVMSYKEAQRMSEMTAERFQLFFNGIIQKGFIEERMEAGGLVCYELFPVWVGWVEFQLNHGKDGPKEKETAHRFEEVFRSFVNLRLNRFPFRPVLNKTFPLLTEANTEVFPFVPPEKKAGKGRKIQVGQQMVNAESTVLATDTVNHLIDRFGRKDEIAVVHCFCRQQRKLIGIPCQFQVLNEGCIFLGSGVHHVVKHGFGRAVSREEAFDIVTATHEAGAVHTVFHEQDALNNSISAICNCCWDCCGFLRLYNAGASPLAFKSHQLVYLREASACVACGICVERCPTAALSLDGKVVSINESRCIGCGQCVDNCPKYCLDLRPKERTVYLPLLKESETRL